MLSAVSYLDVRLRLPSPVFLTFAFHFTALQLKQGRPVQREAVLAGGAGDYTSMMYGDKEAPLGSVSGPTATSEADAAPAAADSVEKDVVNKAEAVESTPASAPAVPAASSGTHLTVTSCMMSCFIVIIE
jgi:hypothetical protein